MKVTLNLLLFFVLSAAVSAQSTAVKFDEFEAADTSTYMFDDEVSFKERLERFIRQLRLERRDTKVYLIHYQARVSERSAYTPSERRASRAEWEIVSKNKMDQENVVVIDGGLRERDTLEFWIGRRNAPPPELTPTYPSTDAVICPSIWLNDQGVHIDDNEPASFSASLSPKLESGFVWKVSPGKILDGQGTGSIRVDVKGIDRLKVSVLADGISNECVRERTRLFSIGRRPVLVDEFGRLPNSDIQARLDTFLTELSNNPSWTGYMILYGARSEPRTLEAAVRLVTKHFYFRRFSIDRIKIVKGGYWDHGGMQIWLLPDGVAPPKPNPSVDASFVRRPQTTKRKTK